ncbi:MAG: hypothetical protein LRY55_12780, partial [Leadbetterella sp.]|nr:hypothetical protein [Leadbetterella sp.]
IDQIKEATKKEWLLSTLKIMGINFNITESAQTIDEYNEELIAGDREIENNDFLSAINLKNEIVGWK